ncbi:MAG: Holliday junction resolvase RuvX [Bacteroidetes bacterium]|jgi:putative Holliday junction resolvase|nr:Holliday junction resolvase RuvX [Bacteroidota bacterium]MBP6400902.1 Holliday junction resolvase RuvX [Bacteroidia bacterium]MBK6838728.1 Holliday junction resolvase RuvX [Bacteroidota bacterium]MBK9524803.1 Holliday junction resolvase RuvX [Bacteroidota bacterium]MBK9542969.1 Holliday junction resolvase RuvX [Bacteroidota bacterium]
MSRILAIDYGTKRVGLAVTDPNQIIATALDTVYVQNLMNYLKAYTSKETVESFVVGEPRQMDNSASEITPQIEQFIRLLKKEFPDIPVFRMDERFTSKMASQALLMSGLKKKDRQDKALVDRTSAVIILQSFMESRNH